MSFILNCVTYENISTRVGIKKEWRSLGIFRQKFNISLIFSKFQKLLLLKQDHRALQICIIIESYEKLTALLTVYPDLVFRCQIGTFERILRIFLTDLTVKSGHKKKIISKQSFVLTTTRTTTFENISEMLNFCQNSPSDRHSLLTPTLVKNTVLAEGIISL